MNKVLAVARTEYLIAATSKAFIIGIIMMPIFMGGAFAVQYFMQDQVDVSTRKVAIVDESGQIFSLLKAQSDDRNENEVYTGEGDDRKQTQAKFELEAVEPGGDDERLDVTLTERVKDGELFAFVFVEPDIFDPEAGSGVRYHSQTPSYRTLPNWVRNTINGIVRADRANQLGLSQQDVASLSQDVEFRTFGLVTIGSDGEAGEAKEENELLTLGVPIAGLMLMFMMVMTVAPSMLNNVLEEKMQKISEFLVSSVTPFQLMLGKLLGAVAIGLTLSAIYLGAAYSLAAYFNVADQVPVSLYAWFVFFLFIALVIFGSIFSAIGAACSEIRDAQSLMTPVMLLVIIPMMCIAPVIDSPSSTFARAISLFPPATPMIMFMRIAIPPGPAAWEIVLAVLLSGAFAAGCVWAAGRVFRVGILSQGQAPTMAKLIKWIFAR